MGSAANRESFACVSAKRASEKRLPAASSSRVVAPSVALRTSLRYSTNACGFNDGTSDVVAEVDGSVAPFVATATGPPSMAASCCSTPRLVD